MKAALSKSLALCPWFAAIVVCCALGCGGPVASLKGTVRYEGKAVARGVISITPVGGKGKAEGSKILDGVFAVESIEPGEKQITVIGVVGEGSETEAPATSENKLEAIAPRTPAVPQIPTNATGNGQTITIKPGPQEIEIELSKPGDN